MKLFKCSVVPATFVKHVPTTKQNLPFTLELKPMEMAKFVEPVNFQVFA